MLLRLELKSGFLKEAPPYLSIFSSNAGKQGPEAFEYGLFSRSVKKSNYKFTPTNIKTKK